MDEEDQAIPRCTEDELRVRWDGPGGPPPSFSAIHLKNPEATKDEWRGGWFRAGGAVRQVPDGILYFVNHRKNIVSPSRP